jgi:hypothetical protein
MYFSVTNICGVTNNMDSCQHYFGRGVPLESCKACKLNSCLEWHWLLISSILVIMSSSYEQLGMQSFLADYFFLWLYGSLTWMDIWQYWMDPSKPWRGLPLPIDDQVRQLFEASVSISLGDGATASFWHDAWLFDKSLRVSFLELFALCTKRVLTLRETLADSRWCRHYIWCLFLHS